MSVKPRIRIIQLGNLMRIEAPTVAKKPRFRYESGEMQMVLSIGPDYESNKHLDTQEAVSRR